MPLDTSISSFFLFLTRGVPNDELDALLPVDLLGAQDLVEPRRSVALEKTRKR